MKKHIERIPITKDFMFKMYLVNVEMGVLIRNPYNFYYYKYITFI